MERNEFVKFLFDRDTSAGLWYLRDDFDAPDLGGEKYLELFRWIMNEATSIAECYSESQLAQGLLCLINPSSSPVTPFFYEERLNVELKSAAIHSMRTIFDALFAKKCTGSARFNEQDSQNKDVTFDYVCFMWWDIFPWHGVPERPSMAAVSDALIQVLADILEIDNFACKESALHGLGHWHSARPQQVEGIINGASPRIPSDLLAYAECARSGKVQ